MAKGCFKYSDEDRAEMVRLAMQYRSFRRTAREMGVSYSTVIEACAKAGFHLPSPQEKSLTIKSITVDGLRFALVKKPYYYRRHTPDGKDETLSQYMYRKIFGEEKPKGLVVMFRDGDHDNYSAENIYWITSAELTRIAMSDPERYEASKKKLNDSRQNYFAEEKRNPLLKKRRFRRVWSTRRQKDPDNEWAKKMVETKSINAEKRGYYFDEESRRHMSEAHVGNTREVVEQKRLKREQEAIRNKLGMR